jgi:hypothetical protein
MVAAVKNTALYFTVIGVITVAYQAGQTFAQAYFGLLHHLIGLF